MWEQNGTIYAARTNQAATQGRRGERAQARRAARPIYRLNGEGSAGPLDLIVNDGQGLWHQQVWPKLSLTGARRARPSCSASPTPEIRSPARP